MINLLKYNGNKLHLIVVILMTIGSSTYAQRDSATTATTSNLLTLPPLIHVVDSALQNASIIDAQKKRIQQKKELTSIERKKIFRALTINSQYSYGNNSALIDNQRATQPYLTATATNFYSGGLFINVSIYQIIARKNNIENARLQIEIEKDNLEIIKRNIRVEITNLYLDCSLKAKVVHLRRNALSISNMNYEFAEQSFAENTIKIQTYTDVAEVNVKMKVAFEQAFSDYIRSIITLEEYSGIKIR
jgi:outer membrane protein TolC